MNTPNHAEIEAPETYQSTPYDWFLLLAVLVLVPLAVVDTVRRWWHRRKRTG